MNKSFIIFIIGLLLTLGVATASPFNLPASWILNDNGTDISFGDGISNTSSLVPYSGATSNVYLGNNRVIIGPDTNAKLSVLGAGENGGVRTDHIDIKGVDPVDYTATAVSGSGLEIGEYTYFITYETYAGETKSVRRYVDTTSGNQAVELSGLATDDVRVLQTNIYRNKVDENQYFKTKVASISPDINTYTDITADVDLIDSGRDNYLIYQTDESTNLFTVDNVPILRATSITNFGKNAGVDGANQGQPVSIGNAAGYEASNFASVFVGYSAGRSSDSTFDTGIGSNALQGNTGSRSASVGYYAGYSNTGNSLTSLGFRAGYGNQNSGTVSIGKSAGYNGNGRNGVFIGKEAGYQIDSKESIGIGLDALKNSNVYYGNIVAIGLGAGQNLGNSDAYSFLLHQTNVNDDPLIEGNFQDGSVAFGSNTVDGLGDGDINVSNIYYDTLTAKSPIFKGTSHSGWKEVEFPEYITQDWKLGIKVDKLWNIEEVYFKYPSMNIDKFYTPTEFNNQVCDYNTATRDVCDQIIAKTTKLHNKQVCENNGYNWDGKCYDINMVPKTYNEVIDKTPVYNTTVTETEYSCTKLNDDDLTTYETMCVNKTFVQTNEIIDYDYKFKIDCDWNDDIGYYCKERNEITV